MIIIIDYHAGNPNSVKNMIKKIGYDSEVSSYPALIGKAEKIIIPGVGRFDYGIGKLMELGLIEILNSKALIEKVPILGICLGFQLMTHKSEEGEEMGLGWLKADTMKFPSKNGQLKVPHMGWDKVDYKKESYLFKYFIGDARFYFVHSYFVKAYDDSDEIGTTDYGCPFTSAMQNGNIFGVQFHPEKSHKFGMQLLKNFIEL